MGVTYVEDVPLGIIGAFAPHYVGAPDGRNKGHS